MAGILKVDQVQSDSNLAFAIAGANVAYINSTGLQMTGGTLSLAGTTIIPAIGQIKFPATQNASADANTLDDYEEGTWTPVLTRDGTAPTISYVFREGKYTKIGNMVTCWISINNITVSSAGSGNNIVTGLPFAIGNQTYGGSGGFGYNDAFTNAVYGVVINNSQTQIYFRSGTRSSGNEAGGWSSGGYLGLTFSYFTS
jgi:hypothetical protein